MKVGDLVKYKNIPPSGRPRPRSGMGMVFRIDKQYYGSNTAYKISQVQRGKVARPNMVDFIGVTADGIRDRVLVLWNGTDWEYSESDALEVLSEHA